jgi:hypothetical protein
LNQRNAPCASALRLEAATRPRFDPGAADLRQPAFFFVGKSRGEIFAR